MFTQLRLHSFVQNMFKTQKYNTIIIPVHIYNPLTSNKPIIKTQHNTLNYRKKKQKYKGDPTLEWKALNASNKLSCGVCGRGLRVLDILPASELIVDSFAWRHQRLLFESSALTGDQRNAIRVCPRINGCIENGVSVGLSYR